MKRATVVIGANYGDEGKGLVTDYLASRIAGDRKVVVRFNGGAQAGHTVNTGRHRHIFSHFGAGTLAGAETYLAKHFVCNPLLFWKEHRQLIDLVGPTLPTVAVDPRSFVTTPYDMLINQAVEDNRGTARHGSCGVGFGETIERNQYPSLRIHRADLGDRTKMLKILRRIRDTWMPERCVQLRCLPLKRDDPRLTDGLLEKFADAAQAFHIATRIAGAEFMDGKAVIFEGAQGLALDMDGPNFPHVTRSNTGLTNVLPLAKALNLDIDVIYVTRTYLTKHGAGPLPGEYKPDPPIVDETNTSHPYQGTLRFAPLDMKTLQARVAADLKLAPRADPSFAVTWTDRLLSPALEFPTSLRSSGSRREDVL